MSTCIAYNSRNNKSTCFFSTCITVYHKHDEYPLSTLYQTLLTTYFSPASSFYQQSQFIPIATKVNANVGGCVIGFLIPIFIVFYIIQLSLNKTVLLRAVFELDREVAGKVVEEAKEEKVHTTYPHISHITYLQYTLGIYIPFFFKPFQYTLL